MKFSRFNRLFTLVRTGWVALLIFSLTGLPALASSHADAPLISMDRFADNTDVYAFRSTEAGRSGFVTLISNFVPLQEPSAGPQFYRFDDTVLYEIKIDNTGDGVEDISYQFQFTTQTLNDSTVLGHTTINENGVIANNTDIDYNMPQTYSVRRVDSSTGRQGVLIASGLRMPPSAVGPRVTPNYEANLGQPAVYNLANGGKVFAGQRDESFFIDLGGTFDAFNFRSIAATGGIDTLRGYNINTIALELPIQELTRSRAVPGSPTAADAVIGIWSTASRRTMRVIQPDGTRNTAGDWVQISRLGNPLVNEVVIPLRLKDAFNSLEPTGDAVAVPAVLDPELPKAIKFVLATFGGININIPPPPRNDLAQIFALGIPAGAVPGAPNYTTVIQGTNGPHEYLRLNVAIAPSSTPSRLGLLGGDLAGFPNGRRVFDDITDIALRAVLGGTPFTPNTNVEPNNSIGDGVAANFEGFLSRFPYLQTPNQGNQPRMSNFPATQTFPATSNSKENYKMPIVDDSGNLTTYKRRSSN